MSEISHSDELVTKQDLSNFYQGILPYLGGMPDVVGGGFAPVGTIVSFMGTTAPQDYLSCNGATYNIADYPQLTAFFAAQFGSVNKFGGDGVTTFKVPDLRGEFLRGTGTNSHANQGSGSAVGTHQNATEIPEFDGNSNKICVRKQDDYTINMLNADTKTKTGAAKNYTAISGNNYQSGSYADRITIRPTNTSVLYCIKAIESGQVYSTEERIVGTWIDGKPLYQKTVSVPFASNIPEGTETNNETSLGLSNVDTAFIVEGFAKNSSWTTISNLNDAWGLTTSGGVGSMARCSLKNVNGVLSAVLGSNRNAFSGADAYITIRYTKS